MEFGAFVLAGITFLAGNVTEWLRREWFPNRQVRKAVQAEIQPLVIDLNFFILRAMECADKGEMPRSALFACPVRLRSVDYYWNQKPDQFLQLAEWPLLKGWSESLGEIGKNGHPAVIDVIMLLVRLTLPPLDKCIDWQTKRFVNNILARPAVSSYRQEYIMRTAQAGNQAPGGAGVL